MHISANNLRPYIVRKQMRMYFSLFIKLYLAQALKGASVNDFLVLKFSTLLYLLDSDKIICTLVNGFDDFMFIQICKCIFIMLSLCDFYQDSIKLLSIFSESVTKLIENS